MRLYSVAVSSLAIGVPHKWLDNLLSHLPVPGVSSERRGVARRIPHHALLQLALTHELHVQLGLGVRDALTLAADLLTADDATVSRGGQLRVSFDRPALERTLDERLRDALESAPTPRRGRPTGRTTASP
jgi:hypothetical protein